MSHFRTLAVAALLFSAVVAAVAQTPERKTPVGVGDTAPGFTLQSDRGETVSFEPGASGRPTVLVFYRGYW